MAAPSTVGDLLQWLLAASAFWANPVAIVPEIWRGPRVVDRLGKAN